MSISKEIKKEHIISAMNEINKNGVPPSRKSRGYSVEHLDKLYPVKLVISYAQRYATGSELNPSSFISTEARRYLKKLNFKIVNDIEGKNMDIDKKELEKEEKLRFIDTVNEKYNKYSKEGSIEFITFHPSYSYEEFIEGITVNTKEENKPIKNIEYVLKSGIFKNMCKRALANAIGIDQKKSDGMTWQKVFNEYEKNKDRVDFSSANKYVMIIDEINRGNISKIFGELITLLEKDKRLGGENELRVLLPYPRDKFGIPPNIYIIGTMNTADRSIALLDVALRRRFGFIEMSPDFSENSDLVKYHKNQGTYELVEKSIEKIKIINDKICKERSIGRDKQIGHSFLFKVKDEKDLIMVWNHDILPLLEEYCYSNYDKINYLLFEEEGESEWITNSRGIKNIESLEELDRFLDKFLIR